MKMKSLILAAGVYGSVCVGGMLAQSGGGAGGAGGSGSGSGAGNAGASGTAGTTGTPASAPATSAAAATGSVPGTPDMSPSLPSRSRMDPSLPGATNPSEAPSTLPPGVTRTPTPAGVSPISGLPTAQIPTTSSATPPVGADGRVIDAASTTSVAAPAAVERAPIVPAGAEALPAGHRDVTRTRARAPLPQVNADAAPGPAVYVPTPPPALRTEASPATVERGQVWVPGHYTWSGSEWTWVGGSWQRPPTPGASWVPGNYDSATHRWSEARWSNGGATARGTSSR